MRTDEPPEVRHVLRFHRRIHRVTIERDIVVVRLSDEQLVELLPALEAGERGLARVELPAMGEG